MKHYTLLLALTVLPSFAFAEKPIVYKGGISCDKVEQNPDYVLFKAGKEKTEFSSKTPVLSICENESGKKECECYVPYVDEKIDDTAKSAESHQYKVITSNYETIWVTVKAALKDTKRFY